MPRTSSANIDQIIQNAIAPVVQRASAAIAKVIASAAEETISRELGRSTKGAQALRGRAGTARRRRNVEMTEWTADRRARRVPNFVIEATGLATKKKIVAKFGENVTFERGKPLPALKGAAPQKSAPQQKSSPQPRGTPQQKSAPPRDSAARVVKA
jgi:hypothetical protein